MLTDKLGSKVRYPFADSEIVVRTDNMPNTKMWSGQDQEPEFSRSAENVSRAKYVLKPRRHYYRRVIHEDLFMLCTPDEAKGWSIFWKSTKDYLADTASNLEKISNKVMEIAALSRQQAAEEYAKAFASILKRPVPVGIEKSPVGDIWRLNVFLKKDELVDIEGLIDIELAAHSMVAATMPQCRGELSIWFKDVDS